MNKNERISELEIEVTDLEEKINSLESNVDDLNSEIFSNENEIENLQEQEFSKDDFNHTFYDELSDCHATGIKQCIGEYAHKKVYIIIE